MTPLHTHAADFYYYQRTTNHACMHFTNGHFGAIFFFLGGISGQDGTGRNGTPSTGICAAAGMETLRDLLTTTTTVYPVLDP
jgi:hypothetical protein